MPPELAIKAAFEALGANTQTVAFQEVYLALANKTVDGQDNPIGTTFAAKFFEVQSHVALTRHIYATDHVRGEPARLGRPDRRRSAQIITEEATAAGAGGAQGRAGPARRTIWPRCRRPAAADHAPGRRAVPRAGWSPAYDQLRKALGEDTWTTWSGLVAAARA